MSTATKIKKQYILDQSKIRQVKKIVHAKNDTEAITRALDIVIESSTIESTHQSIKGKGNIQDVYARKTV
jgi:hypothetical protein